MKYLSVCSNGGHTHSKHRCHLPQVPSAKPHGRIQSLGPPGRKRELTPTSCILISMCSMNVHEQIQIHTDNNNTYLVGKWSSGVEHLPCMNEVFLGSTPQHIQMGFLQTENSKTKRRYNKYSGSSRKEQIKGQGASPGTYHKTSIVLQS